MKFSNLKKQRGVVLAFSLMLLLLLTLAGTRMIQQNKQQLEMAGSARLISQSFSDTERGLDATTSILDGKKLDGSDITGSPHNDPTGQPTSSPVHQCVPTATNPVTTLKQNIGLAGPVVDPVSGATLGIVSSVRCRTPIYIDDDNDPSTPKIISNKYQVCSRYDEAAAKTYCKPSTNSTTGQLEGGTECATVAAAINIFTDTNDICYQDYDPQATTGSIVAGSCPSEIYKVQIVSTSSDGSKHTIISDHVVGCGTP